MKVQTNEKYIRGVFIKKEIKMYVIIRQFPKINKADHFNDDLSIHIDNECKE